MLALYDLFLYQPLLNVLIFFYNTVASGDFGLAIIFLTVLIRILLFPLFHKSAKHQTVMQRLQPHLKKIQEDHRGDKEKQMEATLKLYKDHHVNPFTGFFLLLAQLPILIALYQIFLNATKPEFLDLLYGLVSKPINLEMSFLGLINLGERSILMVGLAALAQYFQAKLSLPKHQSGELTQAEKVGKSMVFAGPLVTVLIFYNFPAAVTLYWAASSIFSVFQQIIINKQITKV